MIWEEAMCRVELCLKLVPVCDQCEEKPCLGRAKIRYQRTTMLNDKMIHNYLRGYADLPQPQPPGKYLTTEKVIERIKTFKQVPPGPPSLVAKK